VTPVIATVPAPVIEKASTLPLAVSVNVLTLSEAPVSIRMFETEALAPRAG